MQAKCLKDVISVDLMKMDEKSPLNSEFSFSIEYSFQKSFKPKTFKQKANPIKNIFYKKKPKSWVNP